jgi:hypothetical protein
MLKNTVEQTSLTVPADAIELSSDDLEGVNGAWFGSCEGFGSCVSFNWIFFGSCEGFSCESCEFFSCGSCNWFSCESCNWFSCGSCGSCHHHRW